MQKLSALKYCASLSHFFSSTITRCISAICAVGPPKDRMPILAQVANASAKDGAALAVAAPAEGVETFAKVPRGDA
jgi:hypothetical protein